MTFFLEGPEIQHGILLCIRSGIRQKTGTEAWTRTTIALLVP